MDDTLTVCDKQKHTRPLIDDLSTVLSFTLFTLPFKATRTTAQA